MTTTEALRKEVKQYVNKADDKSLRMVKAILKIEQEEEVEEEDWSDHLPVQVQNMIDKSIKDGEEGKGISHEKMMEKHRR